MIHKATTDFEKLIYRLDSITYPGDMQKVLGKIPGNAFFPGGSGILTLEKNISDKPIMILGQDFDSEEKYNESLRKGEESTKNNPTWRNLLMLLKEANIDYRECFYTNAIMGVRKGTVSVGKSPAFKSKAFIKECQNFFLYQIEIQNPKAILVLGKYTAEFLAPIAKELNTWKKIKNFVELDKAGLSVQKNITFDNGITTNLVLLTHPSYRPANVQRRKFQDLPNGNKSEIGMIKEIL